MVLSRLFLFTFVVTNYKNASALNHKVMGKFGLTEILVILAVVLLLFGGKKIPELMKGLGSGIKEFKNAAKDDAAAEKKEDENN